MNGGSILKVGSVKVSTTNGRGLTPEEWAERCLEQIIYVGNDATPLLRDQALAYKERIRKVLISYMNKAINSDRTTLYNLLVQQGHKDMSDILSKQF
jgi:hypothetical protein